MTKLYLYIYKGCW